MTSQSSSERPLEHTLAPLPSTDIAFLRGDICILLHSSLSPACAYLGLKNAICVVMSKAGPDNACNYMILKLTNLFQSSNYCCAVYKIAFHAPYSSHHTPNPLCGIWRIKLQHHDHVPQTRVSADNHELFYCQIKG